DPAAAPTPRQKKDKTPFTLDFSAPPPLSAKELFAPAAPKSSITTTVTAKSRTRKSAPASADDDFTLPDDFGFNSQNLLRLFLKPKTTLKMRRRGVQTPPQLEGGEADVQFWAQAGAAGAGDGGEGGQEGYGDGMHAMGDDYGGGFGGDGGAEDDGDDFPPPFDTQWLAVGDEDTPSGASPPGGDDEDMDDLAAATQGQLRRVRPEMVSYAKRATRVDVRKLKDSIWRELEEVVIPVKEFPPSHAYDPSSPPPTPAAPTKAPQRAKREALIPVVSNLRKQYPKDKMDEISTSYMFICLLHLANEKGLRIQVPAGEDDDELRKVVGGLEGLRVLKEVV
ncbi:hypothetical protein JCM3770_005315, partial [Rhodotorula araucariae]